MASALWLLGLFPQSRLKPTVSKACQGQTLIFIHPVISNVAQIGRLLATDSLSVSYTLHNCMC